MKDQKKPVLEPKTQAFIDAVNAQGGKPLYELSYKDARKVLEDAQSGNVTKLPANVEERVLPVGPQGEVSVRIYRPIGAVGLLPVVIALATSKRLTTSRNRRRGITASFGIITSRSSVNGISSKPYTIRTHNIRTVVPKPARK